MENKNIAIAAGTTAGAGATAGACAASSTGAGTTAGAASNIATKVEKTNWFKQFCLPKFNIKGNIKVPKVSLWFMLALLVARELVPGIEEHIPAVYAFVDTIAVPVVNWVYAIATKLLEWIASLPLLETILGWLASLAM